MRRATQLRDKQSDSGPTFETNARKRTVGSFCHHLAWLLLILLLSGCMSWQGANGARTMVIGMGMLSEQDPLGGPVQATVTTVGFAATIDQVPRNFALGYRRAITVRIPGDWQGTLHFEQGQMTVLPPEHINKQ
jgi:hypothetical protein